MRRVLLGCGFLLSGLIGLLVLAGPASAHAVVISTNPADGARLSKAPASVSVKFDESVGLQLGYLRVVNSSGARVDTGAAGHPSGDSTSISVGVKAGSGDGTYLVSWRVISADSHPVAGSVRFVVGNGALGVVSASGGSATVSTAVSSTLGVIHGLGFAGVMLLGGSWLVIVLWPAGRRRPAVPRLIWTGWGLAAVSAAAEFAIQGPYDSGGSLGRFWHSALLQATLHSTTGELISFRLVVLGVLGALLSAMLLADTDLRTGWNVEFAAMAGVGVIVTYAAAGHSQSANPRWFAIAVDALHLGAASVWLGGLAVLLTAGFARVDPDHAEFDGSGDEGIAELSSGLSVFSKVAMTCVATLAVTGTIQAWREVGVLDALWSTTYGRLVLAKIALFGVLVMLGHFARRHVLAGAHQVDGHETAVSRTAASRTSGSGAGPIAVALDDPPAPPTGPSTVHRLRRTVIVEALAGAAVLGVTGVLISQPPGRVALDAQRSKPKVSTVAVTSAAKAVVEINPGKHGLVQVAIQLSGAITPTSVTATATLPAKDLGPLPVPLQLAGPNSYTASGVLLPAAGTWQITVTVQTSQFNSTTAVASVKLS